jgi:hypothetical protein
LYGPPTYGAPVFYTILKKKKRQTGFTETITKPVFYLEENLVQSTCQEKISAEGMAALVRCGGNVYYQVDYRAAIGRQYDAPEGYTTTRTENIKQLKEWRVVSAPLLVI